MVGGCVPFGGGGVRDWDRGTLERAKEVAQRHGGRGWAAWEDGRLGASWRTHHRGPVLSVTKSMSGLACARAMGEGWLDLGEKAAVALPEWRADPVREKITLRMLLQMTSGLEDGAGALYRPGIADKGKVALALGVIDEPGSRFRYGPASWEVLGEVLHRKLVVRGETLARFLERAVIGPLRLSAADWRADGRGRYFLSTGAQLNVTEMGRLGRAIGRLAAGREAGGISAADFRKATSPSSANPMFGGGVWTNQRASRGREIEVEEALDTPRDPDFWRGACLSDAQPPSMLALIGSAGQRVFIWPREDRVMARLGYSSGWRDGPLLRVV